MPFLTSCGVRLRALAAPMLLVWLALVGCAVAAPAPPAVSSSASSTAGFTNPVWESNFPDPMVVDGGNGTYWAFATNGNGANVQTLSSPDLVSWEQGPDALPELARWSTPGDVWAPEVAVHGSRRFLLYYTTRAPGGAIQCVSVAVAGRPSGPYVDKSAKPLVCEEKAGGSIDAHPFTTKSGERYLYWKNDGNRTGVDTYISVQRLDKSGTRLIGQPRRLFKQDLPWEGDLVEAPFVWQVGKRFVMFYSANAFASADYAVGVATAATPLGPFEKQPDPVLVSNDVAAGPGHCSVFERNGKVWMLYHAWAPDAIDSVIPGRTMWLSEVRFGADGSVSVEKPAAAYPVRP